MAWFRPMGVDEVAYHQATVVGRADDHPGAALDYYGSRGETPLRWGGAGAARLGLRRGHAEAYEAAFGPGGFRRPGDRASGWWRRSGPGSSWSSAPTSPSPCSGVIDRADDMHSILDAETDGDDGLAGRVVPGRGGRRGRAQTRTATGGLVYARTRHATSRAGDPSPHDHVLVANVVEMLDGHRRASRASTPPQLRDTVEAATMVGRLHSAAGPSSSGYASRPTTGRRGNLRHWRIVRDARRGVRAVLQALRRDRRLPRRHRPRQLPGPRRRRPRQPGRQAPHRRRRAGAPAGEPSWSRSAGPSTASPRPSTRARQPEPTSAVPAHRPRDRRPRRRGARHRRRPHGPPQDLHPHPADRRGRPPALRTRPGRARPGRRPHPRRSERSCR